MKFFFINLNKKTARLKFLLASLIRNNKKIFNLIFIINIYIETFIFKKKRVASLNRSN